MILTVGRRRSLPTPPVVALAVPAPVASAPQPGFSPTPPRAVEIADEPPPATPAPAPAPAPATSTFAASGESPSVTPVSADRLSGIDRLLAQADELPVPPAPRPRFERNSRPAADDSAKIKKVADAKKLADAKQAAAAKAEEQADRAAIGLAGTNWVQLAGGANAARMQSEFKKLSAKSSALRRKGGAVTAGKDYFRLLTGPFDSKSAAQEFVNQLAKDDVDGFSWTRTPATLKIEKLSPK